MHPKTGQLDTGKLPLSAVLIVKNAAHQLEAALLSLHFCQEIVVVDSGSTDHSVKLAARLNARVIQKEWLGFGLQKQFAVAQAQFDWVICLDADERVSAELESSIRSCFNTQIHATEPIDLAGFEMPRCNFFLGRYLQHGEGYPDYSRRLFNRKRANWTSDVVHEKVQATAPRFVFHKLKGDLIHNSAETLEKYIEKQNRYTTLQASRLAEQGKYPSTLKLFVSPCVRFIKFYFVRAGFLDGWQGFVHIAVGCFNSFIKYAKAREIISAKK